LITSNKSLTNHTKWNKRNILNSPKFRKFDPAPCFFWHEQYISWKVKKQIQKQDQVWFKKISTHKGVGTVQSWPNPLKHGNEVTSPLYEIMHAYQERFQRRSDLTTFWSRTKIIFIVQPRNSCDIHMQKPRCISDRSSTWTQMKIMMNTTTFWSILKSTTTF